MANIARLGVVLGLNTAEFQSGLAGAMRSVNSFAQDQIPKLKNGLMIGAAAFSAMAYKVLEMSDRISDLADAADMSIASVLSINNAIEQSGGKSDDAGKAILKFTENIDKAALGSKELQDKFKRIGVSLSDLSKLSSEDLFKKSVEGIAKLEEVSTRTGAKMALFGKGIRDVDMTKFNDEIKKGKEEFEQYAEAVAIAGELNDKLAKKANALALTFTKEVMPALNGMFESLAAKGGAAEAIFVGLRYAVSAVWLVLEGIQSTAEAVKLTFSSLASLENLKQWSSKMDEISDKAIQTEKKILEFMRGVQPQEPPKPKDDERTGRDVIAAKDPEADKQANMLKVAGQLSEEYDRQRSHSLEMLRIKDQLAWMTDNERRIQETVNEVLDATSKKLQDISDKREAAAGRGANEEVLAEYDRQAEAVNRLGKEYEELARQQQESSIAAQQTFEYGWNKAFRQYAEDATNYATMGKDMFQSMTGAMNKAIDEFVDNGKFSFSDFAASVIKDLIKIELKMAAMQLFKMGFQAVSGAIGGAIGGAAVIGDANAIISGMQGSGITASVIGSGGLDGGAGALSFPVRANGGTVNSPTIVGERGAELFMPSRSGTIIPNNNLREMGNSGGITYNGTVIQNMTAIDTQSGLEFLAKNKMNIYALNQSASRSMPTSR
jgi:lambda family phage tail tape measure protein